MRIKRAFTKNEAWLLIQSHKVESAEVPHICLIVLVLLTDWSSLQIIAALESYN
jgi:hypothetical protein